MEVAAQKKLKVPKLRFREFKDGWNGAKLGEIGEFKNGLNKDKDQFGFGFPFVNLMDVFGKTSIEMGSFDLVNANEKELGLYNLQKGDVLFIRSSVKREGVGETVLVLSDLPDTVYSGFLIRFRDNGSTLSLHFKKYCFGTSLFRNELLSRATTSANTNINQDSLGDLDLLYPSLPEQQKIASFLSAVDARIGHLTRKKELLEQYKKGVMQQLFSQQLRFKREDGSDYEEWEEKRLGELGSFKGGGTPSTEVPEFWEGDIPWVSSSDIAENDVRKISITRFISEAAVQASAAKIVPPDSLLFVARVGVGKLAVSDRPLTTSQDFANFTPYEASGLFLAFFFLANNRELKKYAQGTSIQGFTTTDLKAVTVQLPCLEEQQKIAAFLSGLDKKIEAVGAQIELTQQFKKGLLQEMFV